MSDEALERFTGFLDLAQQVLSSEPTGACRGHLHLAHSSSAPLAERVTNLEAREEFHPLCQAIEAGMGASGFGAHGWKHAVGNWFRRSGLYHRVASRQPVPETHSLFDSLQAELSRRESTVTHLALIEYVYFHNRQLDFGRYKIVRFTKDELDALLQTQVRADFYPWAVVPTSDLARYWWIVVRQKMATRAIGRSGRVFINLDDLDIVNRYYTELPLPVELILQELALFPWRPAWASNDDPRWEPCRIPICLRADDHLTVSPSGPRADASTLETEPDFDPHTGKEVGERPTIRVWFSEPEAEAFERFVRREGTRLHLALTTEWSRPLVEVASKFFAKAFVSDGLEQLLWHITTVEALVGEQGEGLTERLARRLAAAIGSSEDDRQSIRNTFKQLYEFRSELVHGRTPRKAVLRRHLFEAREFARNLLRWYLRLLEDIRHAAEAASSYSDIPDRHEILQLLDLKGDGVRKLRWLLPTLPASFPNYPDLSG